MRKEDRPVYIAFDDTEFKTPEACKSYEREHASNLLVGLTAARIGHALLFDPDEADLTEALENVGVALARARRARGDLKRTRSTTSNEPEGVESEAT